MQAIADDRSADRKAELLRLRVDLLDAGPLFVRSSAPQAFVRVAVVGLGLEFVRPGTRYRSDGRAGHLPILRLVVGGDDLVLIDRELREGIAARVVLTRDSARLHIALLADTINVEITCVSTQGTAAQTGVALRIRRERHPGYGVREL